MCFSSLKSKGNPSDRSHLKTIKRYTSSSSKIHMKQPVPVRVHPRSNCSPLKTLSEKLQKRPIKREKYITVYHFGVWLSSIQLWFLRQGPRGGESEGREIDALLTKSISTLLRGKTVSDALK